MERSPLLTVLVTTYNRAQVLDALLEMLEDYQQRGLVFDVLVSDDCSPDNTVEVCEKWGRRLKGFNFIKTERNLGMDNNFRNVYENCQTDYCWLLGDTRHISYEGLKSIIDALETKEYDALILKCREEMPQKRIEYGDINELMSNQGWHITNNASCVIPRTFINSNLYNRYMGTTFLHMGIFVENLCLKKSFKVLYMGDVEITELNVVSFDKVGWTKHPFLNFGKLWYEFVMSLPNQIDVDIKHKVLLDHDKHTGLFSLSDVHRKMVSFGETYKRSYIENRKYMRYVTSHPTIVYDILIRCIPLCMYTTAFSFYKKYIKRC